MARRGTGAKPATSDQVKDWERQRKAAEAARREEREDTSDVGDRLREVYRAKVGNFVAVPPDTRSQATVRAAGLTTQQLRSLTRVFEADGYTVAEGRTT